MFNTGAKFNIVTPPSPIIKALVTSIYEKQINLLSEKLINLSSEIKNGKDSSNVKDIICNSAKSLKDGNGFTPEFLNMISTVKNEQCNQDFVNNENITVNVMRIEDHMDDKSDANIKKSILDVIKPPFGGPLNLAFFENKKLSVGLCGEADTVARHDYTDIFAPRYNERYIFPRHQVVASDYLLELSTKTYVKNTHGVLPQERTRFCRVGADEFMTSTYLKNVTSRALNIVSNLVPVQLDVIPAHPNNGYTVELGHCRNLISCALNLPGIRSIYDQLGTENDRQGVYKAYCENVGAYYFNPALGFSTWSEERNNSGMVYGRFKYLTDIIGLAAYNTKQDIS